MVVVLAVKFWAVVPELEKHKRMPLGMVCGGTRHEALWECGWGRTYLGPRRVTATK